MAGPHDGDEQRSAFADRIRERARHAGEGAGLGLVEAFKRLTP